MSTKLTVFTCGVFDLFHAGHLDFLERARALGDSLIVAVNDDDYVARTRGPGRPVYLLADRIKLLRGLRCVDVVLPLLADNARELIRELRPDILVKGSECNYQNTPEVDVIEAIGGCFVTLESLPIHTATIIEHIRRDISPTAYSKGPAKPPNCRCGFPDVINNLYNCGHEQTCPAFTS